METKSSSGLAERIQERLTALGLSARAASLKAGLGPDAIRIILRGRSQSPGFIRLSALATALQCDVKYLTGEAERPGSPSEVEIDDYSPIKLYGVIENGRWLPRDRVRALDEFKEHMPRIPVRKYSDYQNLTQWAAMLGGPVKTNILNERAILHIVEEEVHFVPETNDIVLLEIEKDGFVQRQIWKVDKAFEQSMALTNDAASSDDLEDIDVSWHRPKGDIEEASGVLLGSAIDSQGQEAGMVVILGRIIAAHISLDYRYSRP